MVQEKDFIIDMRDSTQLRHLEGSRLNRATRRDRGRKGEREKQRERGGGAKRANREFIGLRS